MMATGKVMAIVENTSGTEIARYETSVLADGIHAGLIAVDAANTTFQMYIDGLDDANAVTPISDDDIDWSLSGNLRIGTDNAGANAADSVEIQLLGLCIGTYLDISSEAVRKRFFRSKDDYPSSLAGSDGRGAFGVIPQIWITDGDATNNRGSGPDFTEAGAVPATTVAGDLTTPITPAIFLNTKGDQVTVNTNVADMGYDYDRDGIGSNGGLPELLQQLEPDASPVDREQMFLSTVQGGFAPSLGDYIRDDKDARALAEELVRSCGASMYFNEYSLCRLFYLVEPDASLSVGTITLDDLVEGSVISRRQDRGESLSTTVRSWKIQTPHRATEIVFDAERKDVLGNDYGITSNALPLLDPLYAEVVATREAIRTLLTDGQPLDADAYRAGEILVEKLLGLYTRKRWIVSLEHYHVPAELDIGQVWLIDTTDANGSYRHDLVDKPHLVISRPAIRGFQGLLELWG